MCRPGLHLSTDPKGSTTIVLLFLFSLQRLPQPPKLARTLSASAVTPGARMCLLRWQAGRSLSRVSGLYCSVKSDASVCARGKTEPRTHSVARPGQDQVGLVPAGTANSSNTSLPPGLSLGSSSAAEVQGGML